MVQKCKELDEKFKGMAEYNYETKDYEYTDEYLYEMERLDENQRRWEEKQERERERKRANQRAKQQRQEAADRRYEEKKRREQEAAAFSARLEPYKQYVLNCMNNKQEPDFNQVPQDIRGNIIGYYNNLLFEIKKAREEKRKEKDHRASIMNGSTEEFNYALKHTSEYIHITNHQVIPCDGATKIFIQFDTPNMASDDLSFIITGTEDEILVLASCAIYDEHDNKHRAGTRISFRNNHWNKGNITFIEDFITGKLSFSELLNQARTISTWIYDINAKSIMRDVEWHEVNTLGGHISLTIEESHREILNLFLTTNGRSPFEK